jgi:predicted dehydrogenase
MSTSKSAAITRRSLLGGAAAAIGAFTIIPRSVLGGPTTGKAPSDKLNIACIGVDGRGRASVDACGRENIVALCDVDERKLAKAGKDFPAAKKYKDFRKLLDEMDKGIDAVTVGTPDHTHSVAVMAAIKRGKHVFCEKPLAHSIGEVRAMMQAAREHKVVTQLGNQGHSSSSIRTFCEWIWDGAIGNVNTVHAGCNMKYSAINKLGRLKETHEVPATLDWDLWLGPAAERPYNPMYLPGSWRSWLTFGTGVIGDWICHVVDPVFWALDLGAPATIQAQAKDYDPKTQGETCPMGTAITYQFPAKGKRAPVTLHWYDGTETLPRPADLEPKRTVPDTGAIVLGDKGGITYGSHGAGGVRIFPEEKMKAYSRPKESIPRVAGHHEDWLDSIRKGKQAGSNFDYGGPLTELALLGVIAFRMLGTELKWDGEKMRFTNCDEANQYVAPPLRKGWEI